MSVELRLLGEVQVRVEGRSIPLGHARQRCVLAGLAVDLGQPVSVGQLIERVWGGRTPGDARSTLYSYVARLRRALAGIDEVAIRHGATGYALLMPRLSVDLHRFRQLLGRARAADDSGTADALFAEALALWVGEPFAGLDSPWLDDLRRTLDLERLAAALEHTDLLLRNGAHDRLLPELVARRASHPLDERVAGQLMLALHRTGRSADALRHYEEIRQRLRAELGTDPGSELRVLHQRILVPDPTPAAVTVPRQLPLPPRLFTGRHHELDRMSGAVAPGATLMVTAIGGAGGIGKTWLALHWAHQHTDRFPDGQLYADLRGFDPTGHPTPPEAALRGFLGALGVDPAGVPAGLNERAALFRSLVAGRRMLIVADNARDTDQVIPLLPGSPTCTVLITSRYRLTGLAAAHPAHLLDLDVLPEPEARQVLARQVPQARLAAEPEAVAELLAVCAGLPLALSVAAVRAAHHPHFPLTTLARELRDASARLDALDAGDPHSNLRAVLSWSYRELGEPAAAAFVLLGLAPGPDIGLSAAAALTGLPPGQARTVLRELESASLVRQDVPDRYRMHDLTRLYAAEEASRRLSAEVGTAALRRVVDHYLWTSYAGHLLLNPRDPIRIDPPTDSVLPPTDDLPADVASALRWFDTEHSCLLAVQRLAAERGWHTTVWQLAWSLNTFQIRRGHQHDNVASWRAGLAAAGALAEPAIQRLARERLARACARSHQYAEALELLRQTLTLAEQAGDLPTQAAVHGGLSLVWEMHENYRLALSHSIRALRLHQTLGDPAHEAGELAALGWHLACLGRYEAARHTCEHAIACARRLPSDDIEAAALDTLGYIAQHTGQHATALHHYSRALAIFRAAGRVRVEADIVDHIGDIHADLGNLDDAQTARQRALELYRQQHRTADADRVRLKLRTDPH